MSTPPRRPPAPPKPAVAHESRRRREVLIALLALPVLLVLGLLAGNALTDSDTVDVAGGTPVGAAPVVPAPQPQGPTAATTEPTTEPTTAPSTEATTAPSTEPTTTAPSTEPTEAPTASRTSTAPAAPGPSSTAPAPAEQRADEDEPAAADETDRDGARTAPVPQAGRGAEFAEGAAGRDVRTWQARMVERGWVLRADGVFGPRTESVVRSFQAEKGLDVDGVIGTRTWTAAWTTPIT